MRCDYCNRVVGMTLKHGKDFLCDNCYRYRRDVEQMKYFDYGIGIANDLPGGKTLTIHDNVIKSSKVPVNVITPSEIRCSRCDHMAKHHYVYGGCEWGYQKGYREYSCSCGLREADVISEYHNKRNRINYTFDLLS